MGDFFYIVFFVAMYPLDELVLFKAPQRRSLNLLKYIPSSNFFISSFMNKGSCFLLLNFLYHFNVNIINVLSMKLS